MNEDKNCERGMTSLSTCRYCIKYIKKKEQKPGTGVERFN
jgi:hypothetical protein